MHITRDDRGATAVEYGLYVALVALALIGAVMFLSQAMGMTFAAAAQDPVINAAPAEPNGNPPANEISGSNGNPPANENSGSNGNSGSNSNSGSNGSVGQLTAPGALDAPTGSLRAGQSGAIDLSWTAPADPGSTAIQGYAIQRSTDGATWTTVTAHSNSTARALTVTGLAAGTGYYFRVAALNYAPEPGPYSPASALITTPGAPGAPTGLRLTLVRAGELAASWTAPQATGGASLSYEVEWESVDDASVTCADESINDDDTSTSATTLTISDLSSTRWYCVRVRTENVAGSSAWVYAGPVLAGPQAPGAPTITSVTAGDKRLVIAFTAPDSDGGAAITSYEYSTNGGSDWKALASTTSPVTITKRSSSSSDLSNGTSYDVMIRAVNSADSGPGSNEVTAIPGQASAPVITAITSGDKRLTVAFTAPSANGGATITNYEYSTNGGTSWKALSPSDATTPVSITKVSSSSSDLSNGTTYSVRIRAVNGLTSGLPSNAVSGKPQSN